jgi:hypothetical protein
MELTYSILVPHSMKRQEQYYCRACTLKIILKSFGEIENDAKGTLKTCKPLLPLGKYERQMNGQPLSSGGCCNPTLHQNKQLARKLRAACSYSVPRAWYAHTKQTLPYLVQCFRPS